MMTRPFGDQVGPSLWKPSVRMRSPLTVGLDHADRELPPLCRVKAM